jgi:DNA-binding response OmpR family regulator
MKILIVDSDYNFVEMLSSWLKTVGYEISWASTIEQAKSQWLEHQPELVLCDTVLKGVDTLSFCRRMCAKHDALIMIITEEKDVHDEVCCLDGGADDYLRKPFLQSQLLAHIHALTRRLRETLEWHSSSVVTVGPVSVDTLHNKASINGKTVRLTPTECKMLYLLIMNVNDVCTAGQIIAYVWGYSGEGDTGLIKAHIRHLRQKIEPNPSKPRYIQSVPGVGYTFIHHLSNDAYPLCAG